MRSKKTPFSVVGLLWLFVSFQQQCCYGWTNTNKNPQEQKYKTVPSSSLFLQEKVNNRKQSRRQILRQFVLLSTTTASLGGRPPNTGVAWADNTETGRDNASTSTIYQFESRSRNKNKNALIRDDYWFMSGKIPPRRLDMESITGFNDPKWNAWGACQTEASGAAGNSCTYVSLSQRIPAYSKYAFNVRLGCKEYQELGRVILSSSFGGGENDNWSRGASILLEDTVSGTPCPAVDALLKGTLLAASLLTSPNYSGPPLELLVARFYLNEASYAIDEIKRAVTDHDRDLAIAAWEFGRDSWNSYFSIINKAIVPKVGDKFDAISL